MNQSRQGSRRSPNAAELAAWREYVETAEAIRQALASGLQSTSGVSPGDYAVLLALGEADGRRLRSSVLAEKIGWERSRLSHHLGRMETRALIRRHRSGTDSRGAEVELTDEGARTFRSSSTSHLRLVHRLFVEALTAEELDAAHGIATSLRRHLKQISSTENGGHGHE